MANKGSKWGETRRLLRHVRHVEKGQMLVSTRGPRVEALSQVGHLSRPSNDTRKKRPIPTQKKTMYRSCIGPAISVSVYRSGEARTPCIATIHGLFLGRYRSFFACIAGRPLRYAPTHYSARIHQNKVLQNTAKYSKIHFSRISMYCCVSPRIGVYFEVSHRIVVYFIATYRCVF